MVGDVYVNTIESTKEKLRTPVNVSVQEAIDIASGDGDIGGNKVFAPKPAADFHIKKPAIGNTLYHC